MAFCDVEADRTFRIKRSTFNLSQFLRDDELATQFAGGSMIISRLCLTDYHHFHFPDSGIPRAAVPMRGKYYAGGPYSLERLVPFYTENYRMVTLFDSDHFDEMAMVEVGAFTVGSIQQRYVPGIRVQKGTRKGFFELGGSTVVLIFRRGVIELDEDLLRNSRNEVETYVHLGDSFGRRPGPSARALRS
jgi:phosphatidylserine decarboxylase